MSSDLKLAFAGTPELAATILEKILASNKYDIATVYTQADKPAGRGRQMHKSAVKKLAESRHLLLRQPLETTELDPDDELSGVDILIVAAYGMLLPESILNRPRLGCINVHTSLLPRWRGAAPIQRAIQAGDSETGVTIMQMDAGLDTGDILLQQKCPISTHETAGSLHDRLALLGAETLLQTLSLLHNGELSGHAQDNALASYARKISKSEAEIDWHQSASTIERTIRAFNPSPVAHTSLNGFQMRIWEAEVIKEDNSELMPGIVKKTPAPVIDVKCADHLVRIRKLQLPGKKRMSTAEFLNGHQNFHTSV